MDTKNVDVVRSLGDYKWNFLLCTELWEKYISENHQIDFANMQKIQFFDGSSASLSSEVDNIPNDKGGIYFYVLENPFVPEFGKYIMYVGRAHKTAYASLRQRAKSHYSDFVNARENSSLARLYSDYAPYVRFHYVPVDGNDVIDKVEEELIVSLTPPCNDKIPSVRLRQKMRAFQY